jgi:hypothetical protein
MVVTAVITYTVVGPAALLAAVTRRNGLGGVVGT